MRRRLTVWRKRRHTNAQSQLLTYNVKSSLHSIASGLANCLTHFALANADIRTSTASSDKCTSLESRPPGIVGAQPLVCTSSGLERIFGTGGARGDGWTFVIHASSGRALDWRFLGWEFSLHARIVQDGRVILEAVMGGCYRRRIKMPCGRCASVMEHLTFMVSLATRLLEAQLWKLRSSIDSSHPLMLTVRQFCRRACSASSLTVRLTVRV
jgi:hypothetical protein